MMRGYPGSRQTAATITNTPNAATVAMVGALDVARGLGISGMLGNRIVGMKGSPSVSYRGELGPLQAFRGWSGPPRGLIPGAAMSLPLTGAPSPGDRFKAKR
jgi:hypothetical protein